MSASISTTVAASEPTNKRRRLSASALDPYALIRQLIWLYIILWLIEGGLRRWFLPGLATPLLLIRDPVVIAIYIVAAGKNLFPSNGLIISGLVLAILCFANALAIGHGNPLVALFGIRCDFLHVPLIFIMARVLRREDLINLAKVAVYLVIPYTLLLVAQFKSPQDAWVNRGVGGSLEGAGFGTNVGDKFRPPGTFSFIVGPAALYPLLTACWFMLVLARKFSVWLMLASGLAILVAIPVSISRLFFLNVLAVSIVGVVALIIVGRLSVNVVFRTALAALLLPLMVNFIPVFHDGMEAFGARWQNSTTDAGGFQEAIVGRVVNGLVSGFSDVSFLGLGTGFSTNVGQKFLNGEFGFGASENEWGRLLYDNGFILGSLLVVYRVALAGTILLSALRAWNMRSNAGLIFASTAFMIVLNGQWGQSTILGAAVISGGLALAASRELKLKSKMGNDGIGKQTEEVQINEAPFAVSAPPKIAESKSELSRE